MPVISEQEYRYANLLFNIMLGEAARDENRNQNADARWEQPTVSNEILEALETLKPPKAFLKGKYHEHLKRDWLIDRKGVEQHKPETDYEFCFRCAAKVRDNLIHGNNVRRPEENSEERVIALLSWTERFFEHVYRQEIEWTRYINGVKDVIGLHSFPKT